MSDEMKSYEKTLSCIICGDFWNINYMFLFFNEHVGDE
jgi:hypothetical protein